MSRAGEVGIYGKIAAQADFFRINAGGFSQAGLDRWFEEAVETMRAEGGRLPDGPTRFFLAPRGLAQAFVGVFCPSEDAAGRTAPLVAFTEIEVSAIGDSLAACLDGYDGFLTELGALCVAGSHLPADELGARTRVLSAPEALAAAGSRARSILLGDSARDLGAAFGVVPRAVGYALRTLGLACDQATKAGPDARSGVITVDAPWPTPAVWQTWLELVRRRLRWREGLPSLLWTDGAAAAADASEGDGGGADGGGPRPGRLLITLGPPSGAALAYLANPRHRSPRFWPLRTDVKAALDQAYEALTPEQRRLIENPAVTLADLTTAFAT
jgi:type VI secretion system ImpM family protein